MKKVTNTKKVTKSKGSRGDVPTTSNIEYLREFINNGGEITLTFTSGSDSVYEKTLSWNTVRGMGSEMPTLFNGVRTPVTAHNKNHKAAA